MPVIASGNGSKNLLKRISILLLLLLCSCVPLTADEASTVEPEECWYDIIQGLYTNATERAIPQYYEYLQEWPVVTKSTTACIIGGLGDLLAQYTEVAIFVSTSHYDSYRALSVALEGLFVSGPLMHYSYEVMEALIPESENASNREKWIIALLQVFIDCLIMNCVYVATLMITTAILQGRIRYIKSELKLEYWNGVKTSWVTSLCFAPMQCAMFRYVPVIFRVLAMNLQDIIWNAAISYVAHRSRKKKAVEKVADKED